MFAEYAHSEILLGARGGVRGGVGWGVWRHKIHAISQPKLAAILSAAPPPSFANPSPPPPPGLPRGPHVLLTTYKLVQGLGPETLARYGVIICDEAHKLKNPTTEQ